MGGAGAVGKPGQALPPKAAKPQAHGIAGAGELSGRGPEPCSLA